MSEDRLIACVPTLILLDFAMADITHRWLIVFKGILFLILGLLASVILISLTLSWQVAILLSICVWSFCRFYYFSFYVIEHYVDPGFRFCGLVDFARRLVSGELNQKTLDSSQTEPSTIE